MDIGWLRDLVICIWGLVATGVVIFVAVLAYSFYHRTRTVLNSIEATSETLHRISSEVENEVVRPVIQVVALVQGIRQGIDAVSRFFKKQEEGKDG